MTTNKTKKLFPILTMLILALCISAFVFCISPTTVHAAETHTHDEITFEPWTATDSLPTSGNYYLTADVTVSAGTKLSATLNLCLNGHSITASDIAFNCAGDILNRPALNIYDCNHVEHKFDASNAAWVLDEASGTEIVTGGFIKGRITVSDGASANLHSGNIVGCSSGPAVLAEGEYVLRLTGVVNIYDGFRICGNSDGGVKIDIYGCLNLYGGSIDHNTAPKGAGIYMVSGGTGTSTVYLHGGVIENNVATDSAAGGGGIYANGNLYIKGAPVIKNNTLNASANNLYTGTAYSYVHISEALAMGADIGVSVANILSTAYVTASEVDFLTADYVGENGYFKSDDENFITEILYNRINLFEKNHTHSTTDGACDSCGKHIHNGIEYLAWGKTDALPTEAGNYYLTNTVKLTSTWITPDGEINLDMNSNSLSLADGVEGSVISVPANSTLSLYDCNTNVNNHNLIWGASVSEKGGGIYVAGILKNYDVAIRGNGNDSSNTSNVKKGGGVYVASGGAYYSYSGETWGNLVTIAGSGVYVEQGGNLYVSGALDLGEVYLETSAVITFIGDVTEGTSESSKTVVVDLQNHEGDVTASSEYVTSGAFSYFTAKEEKCELSLSGNKIIMTDTQKCVLEVNDIIFDNLKVDYNTAPSEQVIISNTGYEATLTNAVLTNGTYFTLVKNGENPVVATNGTNNTWLSVQVKLDLDAGTYTDTITLTYNDGKTITFDVSVTVTPIAYVVKAEFNTQGELIITLSDGTEIKSNAVPSSVGNSGIKNATINADGELIITLTDDSTINAGTVVGSDGTDGTDGREVEFRKTETHIQWKYTTEADTAWRNLVALSEITGTAGANGTPGTNGTPGADGDDGREIELQIAADGKTLQWRYVGDTAWADLFDLSTLKGADGTNGNNGADGDEIELRKGETHIEWKYKSEADTAWRELVSLDSLKGDKGDKGENGADGREVEFRKTETHIQWKYTTEADTAWRDLVALSEITGAAGSNGTNGTNGSNGTDGKDGQNGADGREIELRTDSGYIQWRYVGNDEWKNLISLEGLKGEKGDTGTAGKDGIDGTNGADGKDGVDGTNGADGKDGAKGTDGKDGITPYIGENGNWWVGTTDTGVKAQGDTGATGAAGTNGETPYIGENGNWWIGQTDTGVNAAGKDGKDGKNGENGVDGITVIAISLGSLALLGNLGWGVFFIGKKKKWF